MRGFNCTVMQCATLIVNPPERVNQRVSRALNTAYWDFWAPPATDGAFLFSFFCPVLPAVPL